MTCIHEVPCKQELGCSYCNELDKQYSLYAKITEKQLKESACDTNCNDKANVSTKITTKLIKNVTYLESACDENDFHKTKLSNSLLNNESKDSIEKAPLEIDDVDTTCKESSEDFSAKKCKNSTLSILDLSNRTSCLSKSFFAIVENLPTFQDLYIQEQKRQDFMQEKIMQEQFIQEQKRQDLMQEKIMQEQFIQEQKKQDFMQEKIMQEHLIQEQKDAVNEQLIQSFIREQNDLMQFQKIKDFIRFQKDY